MLLLFFSLPIVQTSIAKKVTKRLNSDFGVNINIDRVGLTFSGDVSLKGVYIEDYKQDTLIHIEALKTSILSTRKAIEGTLEFGEIDLENLTFNIKTYKGERETNLDIFVAKLDTPKEDDTPSSFLLTATDINIEDGVFRLIDQNTDNPQVLFFSKLYTQVENFKIQGPNVSCHINELAFVDSRGIEMKQLRSDFQYTLNQMRFDKLQINTNDSHLSGFLVFDYRREDMARFTDKVKVKGEFKSSKVSFDEINLLYNQFGKGISSFFNTELSGTLNELSLTNLNLVSDNTRIQGDLFFKDMFTSKRPFYMEGDFTNLSSNYSQLKSLLPSLLGKTLPSSFEKLGQFTITGTTAISETMIDAQVTINTKIGSSISDLTLTNIEDIDNASYEGMVSFQGFDLGEFLNDRSLGKISMRATVDGKGFIQENLNTEIIGKIDTLNFNKYRYRNIDISGVLKDQLFDGSVVANDPNFKFEFNGLADFSSGINDFNFKASVDYADLNVLNFVDRDSLSIFKGTIDIDINGNNMDNMAGIVAFKNTYYKNQNDEYFFKNFKVTSSFKDSIRTMTINSPDIIEGELSGNYSFKQFDKLVQNSIGSIYANYSPYEVDSGQFLDFNFKIYNKIVEVFYPELKFGPNTFMRGKVVADKGEFKLTFKSPKIEAYSYVFDKIDLQVDNKNPLFNTYVEIDKINTGFYRASNFNMVNKTLNDTLFFRTDFKGGREDDDNFNLSFYHTINKNNKSVVGLKKSAIDFKGNRWYINEKEDRKNRMIFNKTLDTVSIENIVMNHQDEFISVRGIMLDSTYKDIQMGFKVVDLNKITPLVDSLKLGGIVDGKINILQRQGRYLPNSSITISDASVNDHNYGSLFFDVRGNERFNEFVINSSLTKDGLEPFSAKGSMRVSNVNSSINVNTKFKEFDLSPFSPLGEEVIQDIRGFASGEAIISGKLGRPMINGYLELDRTRLSIPYLNVDLALQDEASVLLREEAFIFNEIGITDTKYNTKGLLEGSITHNAFSDWLLDLDLVAADRLLVLDKEEEEEELYFGTAFISGTGKIIGRTDALTIKVEAQSQEGTSIKIPISDVASIGDNSFIKFLDKKATVESEFNNTAQLDDFKGLELEFDLDVTKDAEVEIVIDKKSGSTLKGRGAGIILMEINTKGKFNMWGDFTAYEGIYNYKSFGLIDKKLKVVPGGTIVWGGDALAARLDMTAVYELEANPAVLLTNPTQAFNRKIPTEVQVTLSGELMAPTPTFEIDFPNTSWVVKSELQYSLQDDDKRQLQALSLLSQGIFVNEVNISQQAITGNLLETASSLLGDILFDEDDIFNVGLNYSQGNRTEANLQTEDRFGLNITTQISERILVNGKIGVPVGGVTQTVIVGDVEVDVLLNEDGTLRAKVFNRENELQYTNVADNIGYTQGIGLSYERDFDTLKELWEAIFKKAQEDKKKSRNKKQKDSMTQPLVTFNPKQKKSK